MKQPKQSMRRFRGRASEVSVLCSSETGTLLLASHHSFSHQGLVCVTACVCSDVHLCPLELNNNLREEVSSLVLTMCDCWFTVTDHRHTVSDAAMLGGADDVLHNDGRLNLMYMDSDVMHTRFSSPYAVCAGKAGKIIPIGSPDPHGFANQATGEELLN